MFNPRRSPQPPDKLGGFVPPFLRGVRGDRFLSEPYWFIPVAEASELPIYFLEVQFQKKTKFYSRLLAEIFLYFYQYDPPNDEWYAIVIYRRRSIEVPAPRRYRELMEHRVRRIYLDEIEQTTEPSIGVGIVQLVVENKRKTGDRARQLINKARQELT